MLLSKELDEAINYLWPCGEPTAWLASEFADMYAVWSKMFKEADARGIEILDMTRVSTDG